MQFPAKRWRAEVIAAHVIQEGYRQVVCFTCGNAASALREQGLRVIEIGPKGDLLPGRWWTQQEIAAAFPSSFDATAGHLPIWLMSRIGQFFKERLGELPSPCYVPSGSGETVACLALAYGPRQWVAVYDNAKPETTYSEQAPLNQFVRLIATTEVK